MSILFNQQEDYESVLLSHIYKVEIRGKEWPRSQALPAKVGESLGTRLGRKSVRERAEGSRYIASEEGRTNKLSVRRKERRE